MYDASVKAEDTDVQTLSRDSRCLWQNMSTVFTWVLQRLLPQ